MTYSKKISSPVHLTRLTHLTFLFVVLSIITGCNNTEESSPFGELLAQQPFAPLTDSIKKDSKNPELYFRRGVLLNTNNLPEPALVDFQKAWSISKQEKYAYGISSLLIDKRSDSATIFLREALKEIPTSILLRLSLARSLDAQGQTDAALTTCNEILQLNPQQVDVLVLKSDLLEKKNMTAESIAVLEQAYAITPYDLELNYNLAYKYAESKNAKVIALSDSLAKKDSLGIHAEPYYYKGIYYANINDNSKAIVLFDEAIKHDYQFKNPYIEKGRILYEQKKYTDAMKVFQLVMRLSPSFADSYFWMAKCQEATGQKAEAKLNYQRAYGLDKSWTEAKEAAERL
jgi:tetratricopeptide (TPR) repeat protein